MLILFSKLHWCTYRRPRLRQSLSFLDHTGTRVSHHATLPSKVSCIYFGFFKLFTCVLAGASVYKVSLQKLFPGQYITSASLQLIISNTVITWDLLFWLLGPSAGGLHLSGLCFLFGECCKSLCSV